MQAVFLNYDEALQDEAVGDLPVLPIPVTYPAYGSAALLPLQGPDYRAEARPLLDTSSSKMTADILGCVVAVDSLGGVPTVCCHVCCFVHTLQAALFVPASLGKLPLTRCQDSGCSDCQPSSLMLTCMVRHGPDL